MKAAFAFALAAATASAQTTNETWQECTSEQGATFQKKCFDAYYDYCDVLQINSADRCNIFTFSDTRVTWDSSSIYASYWSFYATADLEKGYKVTADDMDPNDETAVCYLIDPLPQPYENGMKLNKSRTGMCGFKINVENTDELGSNPITILKDGAVQLMAGSALALAAVLAF